MKYEDLLAIYEADLARNPPVHVRDPMWIDVDELFNSESNDEWLVTDVWPANRQIHIHAARKTGKSLVALWIACNLAKGVDPFSGYKREPVRVAYLDYEMTRDDLRDRVIDMGFGPDDLRSDWFYALHPSLPMMDTQAGGLALIERLTAANVQAVVFDTFSRVVAGDENSNDTYRAFFRWTGGLLKGAGIAMLRLDHEGHLAGRSRGASAKADDVDVVWQLRAIEDGLQLVRMASRIATVPEIVSLRQTEPLGFTRTGEAWPNGTMEKVRELDEAGVPLDATRKIAGQLLKAKGYTVGKTIILSKAMAYRNHRVLGL